MIAWNKTVDDTAKALEELGDADVKELARHMHITPDAAYRRLDRLRIEGGCVRLWRGRYAVRVGLPAEREVRSMIARYGRDRAIAALARVLEEVCP